MVFSHYLTGKRVISKYDFRDVVSLNTAINDLNEKFKFINGVSFEEMFPRGFEEYINLKGYKKNSVEYNKAWETYVKYCSEKYDLEYRYAITTAWDTGNAYTTPIYQGVYNCYVVMTFTDVEEDAGFISFENAKDDIYNNMKTERQNKAFDDYISSMIGNTDVQIKYNR
jgi:hypothetical protein